MVRQLSVLKAKITWNTMTRQTWVMVMVILGLVYALGTFTSVALGMIFAILGGFADIALAVGTLLGAVVVLGWWLVPALYSGLDNTLDPARFAPYVGPSMRLAFAMVVATGVGVAGILTTLLAVIPAMGWLVAGHWLAGLVALVLVPLAMLIAFVWARVFNTWLGIRLRATSTRRDLSAAVSSILFIVLVSPLGLWIQWVMRDFNLDFFMKTAAVAAWTPFGAVFGIPAAVASGDWLAAVARLGIGCVTLAVGLWLWRRVLAEAMGGVSSPVSPAAEEAIAAGRRYVDPTKSDSLAEARKGGAGWGGSEVPGSTSTPPYLPRVNWWQWLGLAPATASMAARTARYWLRDARLMVQLTMPLVFIGMAIMWEKMPGMEESGMGSFFLYFTPTVMGASVGAVAQYDSTALWIPIAAGVPGRQERLGRLLGSLPTNLSMLVVGAVLYGVASGRSAVETALILTIVVTLFMSSLILAMVLGARWVYPVQPPGTSPMSAKGTGQVMTTMLLQFGAMLGALIIGLPALVTCVLAMFGVVPWWASVLVAVIWVGMIVVGGLVVAGRIWDRYCVDVLTTIRSWPGH